LFRQATLRACALALHPGLPVLVCSMHDEAFYAARVLRAGARGYTMKSDGPEKLGLPTRRNFCALPSAGFSHNVEPRASSHKLAEPLIVASGFVI